MISFNSPDLSVKINSLDPKESISEGMIKPFKNKSIDNLISKIEIDCVSLSDISKINRGLHAYRTDGYGISKFSKGYQTKKDKEEQSYHSTTKLNETYLPEIKGKNVFRYTNEITGIFVSYGEWLAEPRTQDFFYKPKIVFRKILSDKIHGTLLMEPMAIDQSLYICINSENNIETLKYILGIVSSKIGAWYLKNKYSIFDALYPWYTKKQLDNFPIKPAKTPLKDKLISLVETMLSLNNEMHSSNNNISEQQKNQLIDRIAFTDNQIDRTVYEIYNLSLADIELLESTQKMVNTK
jgi:hypothetical protein